MRKIRTVILIIAVVVGLYLYLHKEENFKVEDHLVLSQVSNMDINAPSITAPPKYAVIKGTITNTSNKNFKDLEVVYQSGLDTVKALIGSLQKGQSSEFETNSMMVRTNRPDYKLINIPCKEE